MTSEDMNMEVLKKTPGEILAMMTILSVFEEACLSRKDEGGKIMIREIISQLEYE